MSTFVGVDGYRVRVHRQILPTDTYILLDAAAASDLTTAVPDGSFTYLVLHDGVSYEIVRVDGGFSAITTAGFSDVPVTRGAANSLGKFNFPCGRTILSYDVTTPVVQEIVAQAIAAAALAAT